MSTVLAVTGVTRHNFRQVMVHAESLGHSGVLAGYGWWSTPEVKIVLTPGKGLGMVGPNADYCTIDTTRGGESKPFLTLWFDLFNVPAAAFLKIKSLAKTVGVAP